MQENEKTCLHCGEVFIPNRSDAQYCSSSCKQLAYLERKEGKKEDIGQNREQAGPTPEEMAVEKKEGLSANNIPLSATITDNKASVDTSDHQHPLAKQPPIEKRVPGEEKERPETNEEYREWKQFDYDLKKALGENMASMLNRWGYMDRECVLKMNTHLKQWIKTVTAFHKREVSVKEVRALLEIFKKYQESFDFRYLPKNYPYLDFLEELKEKLRLWAVTVEMKGIDAITMLIPKKQRIDFTYVLLDIDV